MEEKVKIYCESSMECFEAMAKHTSIAVRGRHNNKDGDYEGIPLSMEVVARGGYAWKLNLLDKHEYKEVSVVFPKLRE